MANTTTTVLQQILHLVPEDQFESFVGQHKADRYVKKLTCWNQLTILLYAQASGKDSLRDIGTGLLTSRNRWYHLGLQTAAKSTLARANEKRSWQIYESLISKILKKCGNLDSGTASFSFTNDLYALDSTTIDLSFHFSVGKISDGEINYPSSYAFQCAQSVTNRYHEHRIPEQ